MGHRFTFARIFGPRFSRNTCLTHRAPSNFSPAIEVTRNMKERASPKRFRGGVSPRRGCARGQGSGVETEGEEAYSRLKAWPARQGKPSTHTTMSYLAFLTFFSPQKCYGLPSDSLAAMVCSRCLFSSDDLRRIIHQWMPHYHFELQLSCPECNGLLDRSLLAMVLAWQPWCEAVASIKVPICVASDIYGCRTFISNHN